MNFAQKGGYVQSVTDNKGNTLKEYTTKDWTYYGWNYCVVRGEKKVAEGDILSAAVLEVKMETAYTGHLVPWTRQINILMIY